MYLRKQNKHWMRATLPRPPSANESMGESKESLLGLFFACLLMFGLLYLVYVKLGYNG